jgi:hypothetical protein
MQVFKGVSKLMNMLGRELCVLDLSWWVIYSCNGISPVPIMTSTI